MFLGLGDPLLVGGTRLPFAPEIGEYVAEARVSVSLVVGVDGYVALQNRCLIFVTSGLLVLVCQGHQPRRIVGVVGQHPLEIIYPIFHGNPPVGQRNRQYISTSTSQHFSMSALFRSGWGSLCPAVDQAPHRFPRSC